VSGPSSGGFRSARHGRDLAGALSSLEAEVRAERDRTAGVLGAALVAQIKRQLSFPGTGRRYKRGKNRVHVASAPGRPPAVDMGLLRNSIAMERLGPGLVRVGTNVEYADDLELGTETIAPRPYMRTALAAIRAWWGPTLVARLKAAGRAAAARGGR
jgi:hypothetical protein